VLGHDGEFGPISPNEIDDLLEQMTARPLFSHLPISAKRYALYSRTENDIRIEKASGHGLGYLFAPKERKKEEEEEETPQWVFEAWEFLLRKALKLPERDPKWLDLPAMMRMVVTTPNVFKHRRPEWLGPFNFFCFLSCPRSLADIPLVSTNRTLFL